LFSGCGFANSRFRARLRPGHAEDT
jgi:hypothetical protein